MTQAVVVGMDGAHDAFSWRRAHEELVRLAKKRAGLDFEEGRWLLRALRSRSHVELGYGSFYEYAERLFGYGPRLTQEKLRVAEALAGLPETADALEGGSISFSAARELTRVAVPTTERQWLEAARGRTVREVEELVSGHRPGSLPEDVPEAAAKRHVIRFEVSGQVLATFREAMAKLRRDAGEALDDDAALMLMSRHVLDRGADVPGRRDAGRSSYQVALTVCERCRRGKQQGQGELIEVSPEVVEMAECDGQYIGRVQTCVELRTHVGIRETSDDLGAHVNAAELRVEPRAHVDVGRQPTRAKQSVPPVLRRRVLRRDGGCCRVPGCRLATFVDVHHLRLRSEGGKNTLDNLITLCAAHHAALHRGKLLTEGTPSRGLTFRHADGSPYGHAPCPASVDVRARAYRALVGLGFRESETKRALARAALHPDMTLEGLVRQTLRELAQGRH